MFYGMDTEILVKVFGDDPVKMTYQEFADRTRQIFEGAAGDRAWETCFGEAVESNKIEQTEQLQEQEDQIPGQDRIQNHPEYMPAPEIAPAQKTEEQKYNEQQSKIDRETKKKLQEQEDQKKMEHLPSDEPKKIKQLRMASTYYDEIVSGRMTFWFCKNDNFHSGDYMELMEFKEGRHTGRTIQTEITYILDDYTGLEDGYCILAIKVTGAI